MTYSELEAWTPAKEIDEETGEKTIDPSPVSAVFQAIGAASVCWEDGKVPHGVFDEQQALAICNGLIAYLKAHPFDQDVQVLPSVAMTDRQHTLDRDCWCGPVALHRDSHTTLVVHHDVRTALSGVLKRQDPLPGIATPDDS
jgi:hypothetical protein